MKCHCSPPKLTAFSNVKYARYKTADPTEIWQQRATECTGMCSLICICYIPTDLQWMPTHSIFSEHQTALYSLSLLVSACARSNTQTLALPCCCVLHCIYVLVRSLSLLLSRCLLFFLIYRLMHTAVPVPYTPHRISHRTYQQKLCVFKHLLFVKFSVVAVNFLCENVLSWCRVKITFIFH